MSELQDLREARAVYSTLCAMLDDKKWHYDRHDDDLTVTCKVNGEDFPMDLRIIVSDKKKIVSVYCTLSFNIPDEKMGEIASAVSIVNFALIHGGFDYDIANGKIMFRMVSSYKGCLLSKRALRYLVEVSCNTIDDYNDKFYMILKNKMTLDDLQKFIDE